MGIGFVVIAPDSAGSRIKKISESFHIRSYEIGRVVAGERRVIMPFEEENKPVVLPPQ
jgi:phosphoribosylaminoimidazole (AIR) synthetase